MNPIYLALGALVVFVLGIVATKMWLAHAADEETLVLRASIKAAERLRTFRAPPTVQETELAAKKAATILSLRTRLKEALVAIA